MTIQAAAIRKHLMDRIAVYRTEGTTSRGVPVPPARLRAGGIHFAKTEDFVEAGRRDARRLSRDARLGEQSSLLDIGCGAGRLAVGICEELGGIPQYDGIDVNPTVIAWARRHLTAYDRRLRFHHLDVRNERYNPDGRQVAETSTLPSADGSVDVVYSYSVFSHMRSADVDRYLREIGRVLSPAGVAVFTAFVESGVPDEEVNPADYGPQPWAGALHCVRFERRYFDRMIESAGLAVEDFAHGPETDGQSLYVVKRHDSATVQPSPSLASS